MTNPASYLLNGTAYSREALIAFCETQLRAPGTPPWEQALCRFIRDYFDETVNLVQKTSGTTGDPSIINLQRPAMVRSAGMTLRHFNLQPGDRVLLCLPVEYIAGKMMVVRALVGGLHLVTDEPSGSPLGKLAETSEAELESEKGGLKKAEGSVKGLETLESVDFAAMVPLQLHETLKDAGSRAKLEKIGKLLIGGGEINPALREEIGKLRSVEVFESFAMSETYTHFAVRRINGEQPDPFFKVLEGVQIGTDRRGCLVVDVPGVTDRAVVSNDLVRMVGDQEFEWLGRIDNVIKSGGVKIIPEILEKKIAELTGREVLVLGVPDKKLGQKLVLLIEEETVSWAAGSGSHYSNTIQVDHKQSTNKLTGAPRQKEPISTGKESGKESVQTIFSKAILSTVLQKHEIPKEIIKIPSFPRNKSMKIDRNAVVRMITQILP
jgi:o-succinylbenzoate---CoA ligase